MDWGVCDHARLKGTSHAGKERGFYQNRTKIIIALLLGVYRSFDINIFTVVFFKFTYCFCTCLSHLPKTASFVLVLP